jgi:hypothetical protein
MIYEIIMNYTRGDFAVDADRWHKAAHIMRYYKNEISEPYYDLWTK